MRGNGKSIAQPAGRGVAVAGAEPAESELSSRGTPSVDSAAGRSTTSGGEGGPLRSPESQVTGIDRAG